eukprot:TRINITY_DN92855_c0_g1_i1.p1 TRINITY_DN92855_c0_g1~~TRINITY_DN92855_c0_g1_i1.p1  ORF type:complete len:278 (-),score=33.41 TRINITY_DN92855_c0_g1_i1:528-1361(-)
MAGNVAAVPANFGAAGMSRTRWSSHRRSSCATKTDEKGWLACVHDMLKDIIVCGGTGDDEPQCPRHELDIAERCIDPRAHFLEDGLQQPLPPLSLPSFSTFPRPPRSFAPMLDSEAVFTVCPQNQRDHHAVEQERARFVASAGSLHGRTIVQHPSFQTHHRGSPGMIMPADCTEPLSVSSASGGSISTSMGSNALQSTTASSMSNQGSDRQILNIFLGSRQWESIIFTKSDDLSIKVSEFVCVHKLSPLVKAGLMTQLRQMVMMRQLSASVDIVDLL